jgi:predicted DCC family thiol-disulfide oxidoreductase YuxK
VEKTNGQAIVLFDGICNLCNGAVQFIIRRDTAKRLKFASLQSSFAKDLLKRFSLDPLNFRSIIFYENGMIYEKSEAVFRIASYLKGWSFVKVFRIVPAFLRDGIYDLISRNRYRIFGKKDQCMIPTPELKSRFLE